MVKRRDLELKSAQISKPVSYSFKFGEYGAWCIFTINNATGEFLITSDWGHWSHRWHTAALKGLPLHQFLLQCEPTYIVRKLAHNNPADLAKEIDETATIAHVRKMILKDRRAEHLSAYDARLLWDAVGVWNIEYTYYDGQMDTNLYQYLVDPYAYIQHQDSHNYTFLVEKLIPFFQKWLSEHINSCFSKPPYG